MRGEPVSIHNTTVSLSDQLFDFFLTFLHDRVHPVLHDAVPKIDAGRVQYGGDRIPVLRVQRVDDLVIIAGERQFGFKATVQGPAQKNPYHPPTHWAQLVFSSIQSADRGIPYAPVHRPRVPPKFRPAVFYLQTSGTHDP